MKKIIHLSDMHIGYRDCGAKFRTIMLLFGHYHRNKATVGMVYHGVWGIPRCYNAGSSTHKNGNTGYHRVIDLSHDDPRMDYDGKFI